MFDGNTRLVAGFLILVGAFFTSLFDEGFPLITFSVAIVLLVSGIAQLKTLIPPAEPLLPDNRPADTKHGAS